MIVRLFAALSVVLLLASACSDAESPSTISVFVKDPSENPVAGATVVLDDMCCASLKVDGQPRTSCSEVTSATGEADFTVAAGPISCSFTVSAPGFRPSTARVSTTDVEARVDVVLQP